MSTMSIRIDGHIPAGLFLDLLHPLHDLEGATVEGGIGGVIVHLGDQPVAAAVAALEPAPPKAIDRTPPVAERPAARRPLAAVQPAPYECADCDRKFSGKQALAVHRTRSHPTEKGVLAAGHIEGDHPKIGESHDDWETRKRAAAAGAL